MGYTHYWDYIDVVGLYENSLAIEDCKKIIKESPVPLANLDGKGEPTLEKNGFNFNGGPSACENFTMDIKPNPQNWFCKTAQYPYDMVVVACLCAIEDRLGNKFKARSDGDPHEWEEGKSLASKILKRKIKIPQNVIDQVTKYGWWAEQYRKDHPEYNYSPIEVSHPEMAKESRG